MRLAVFDLDHTLLDGDSDYLWGEFLVAQGLVDGPAYRAQNRRFYEEYAAGTLDIDAFCAFSFEPLVKHGREALLPLRQQFAQEVIQPIVAKGARPLLDAHRQRGDRLVITTATNRFVTEPIAELLGVEDLIATDPELLDGRYTGRINGTPNFREGKPTRLRAWLNGLAQPASQLACYSDSRNDIPLLAMADFAIAVDPDPALESEAHARGWPVISLRAPSSEALARPLAHLP
jgi:HAD superfamily hydrolase (TIGR01490 family)